MSGHGQGQAPGYRERPSDRQPTQHHGDSYHRSLRHDEYGHDLSQVRDTRTSGIPGITPRHNPFQYMPSIASQYPRSPTTHAVAGSNVAGAPPLGPLSAGQHNNTTALDPYGRHWMDLEVRDPSWIYRQSATASQSTNLGGHPYPTEIPDQDLIFRQPAQIHDHPNTGPRPVVTNPNVEGYYGTHVSRPRSPRAPLEHPRRQSSGPRPIPQSQRSGQHRPAHGSPSTNAEDHANRPRCNYAAPPRHPRDPDRDRP